MIEFYPEIRLVHIAAVIASGSLFLLRGMCVRMGHREWALGPFPRYLSVAIDTALLIAALILVTILPSSVYANGWLVAKLALLPIYIGLGWLALRSAAGRQLAFFAGALLVYGCMFTIARSHDPFGSLAPWLGN